MKQLMLAAVLCSLSFSEENLDEQMDALSDDDDKANDAQIEPLRKQLDEVHKRERALDKKHDQLECEAEAKLWPLVDEAIQNGSAQPVADRQ